MPLSILVLLLLSTSFASADAQVRPLPAEVSTVPLFSQLIDVRVAGEPGSNGRSVRDDRTDAASEQSFQYLIAAKEPADRSTPLLLEALQVTAEPQNPNRLSNIQVDGSDDLISWSTLASGVPLLSFESEGKLLAARNVELSGGHYRFLRLSLTPAQGFKNVSVSGRPGRPQLRAAEVASRILYVVALLGIVVGGMPWKFRSQSKGGPLHRHDAILSSGVTRLSGLVVLVLLYHGLILTDWHVIEDIRAMVVPFVLFALFTGALLSAMPETELDRGAMRSFAVFMSAVSIPSVAVALHLQLMKSVAFGGKALASHTEPTTTFYAAFALTSVALFGLIALCGYYASLAVRNAISTAKGGLQRELLLRTATGIVGLTGAVLSAILGTLFAVKK